MGDPIVLFKDLICRVANNDETLTEVYFDDLDFNSGVGGVMRRNVAVSDAISALLQAMHRNSIIDTVFVLPDVMEFLSSENQKIFFRALAFVPNLKKIVIRSPYHEFPISLLTLALNPKLREVDLYCRRLIGKIEEVREYRTALQQHSTSLHTLLYANASAGDDHFEQHFEGGYDENHRNDNDNNLRSSCLTSISIGGHFQLPQLKSFCLSDFPLNVDVDDQLPHAFRLLEREDIRLKELYLTDCSLDDPCGSSVVNSAVAWEHSVLSELSLQNNCLGCSTGIAIAQALKTNISLTILILNNNAFGDSACIGIAKALMTNSSLKEISMANCGIGDRTCEVIANCTMKVNRKLEKMDLGNNPRMTLKSYRYLSNGIGHNIMLTRLFDQEFEYGSRCGQEMIDSYRKIDFYLDLNRCGRRKMLQNSDDTTRRDWVNTIISLSLSHSSRSSEVISNNTDDNHYKMSKILYWIKAKPSFLQQQNNALSSESQLEIHRKKRIKRV